MIKIFKFKNFKSIETLFIVPTFEKSAAVTTLNLLSYASRDLVHMHLIRMSESQVCQIGSGRLDDKTGSWLHLPFQFDTCDLYKTKA